MNITKYYISILIYFFLISCEGNEYYRSDDAGGPGFQIYLNFSDTLAYIDYFNDYRLVKGANIHFKGIRDTCIFIPKGTTIIEGHVHSWEFSKDFILIDHTPVDSIFGKKIYSNTKGYFRPKMPYNAKEYISMLKNAKFHQFYIVKRKSKTFYGPYKGKEYLKMRKILGVPKDLIL